MRPPGRAGPNAAPLLLAALLLSTLVASPVARASAYAPRPGDFFAYTETGVVNNGQGSYTGYSDQTVITGREVMRSVSGGTVSSYYQYAYQFSSNQGSMTSDSSGGNFTWSTSTFEYFNATDHQVGYSFPLRVWFAMDAALPVGGTFYLLDTQFTVEDRNYSYLLPGSNHTYVQTIVATGTGQYERDDDYGIFTASFTYTSYFDPATGYIVGYHYVEQDTGSYQGQPGSFTYTDDLGVTSSSYALAPATPPPAPGPDYTSYAEAAVVLLVVLAAVGYAASRARRRRRSLPKHSAAPPPPAPGQAQPWGSNINLGSQPSQQVVIREVAKVNCKYCGTLIPTTADNCPYCGGPRR